MSPKTLENRQRRSDELYECFDELADLDLEFQKSALVEIADEFVGLATVEERTRGESHSLSGAPSWFDPISELMHRMLRRKIELDERTLAACARAAAAGMRIDAWNTSFRSGVVNQVEINISNPPGDELREALGQLYAEIQKYGYSEWDKLCARLRAILFGNVTTTLDRGEPWADRAIEDIAQMQAEAQDAWRSLINHCTRATNAKPTKKWLKEAEEFVSSVSAEAFQTGFCRWMEEFPRERSDLRAEEPEWRRFAVPRHNAYVLRGLCWATMLAPDRSTAESLAVVIKAAFRNLKSSGPRSLVVGNAAAYALANGFGHEGMKQLAMLRLSIRKGAPFRTLTLRLNEIAEREGLTTDEIEEIATPAFDMQDVGVHRRTLGEYVAEIVIGDETSSGAVRLQWINPKSRRIKTVPAAVKAEHPDDLKDLKAIVKQIRALLPAQRHRLDRMFLEQRAWPFSQWRERYLDHPLVGTLARRLIWIFEESSRVHAGIWRPLSEEETPLSGVSGDGHIVGADGEPIDIDPKSASVSLWHPIDECDQPGDRQTRPDVEAWRSFIESHQIRQPFKQAHREIYVLAPAERETERYSNRFAAHFLRQHQLAALCRERGWAYKLRLPVDDEAPPAYRLLPRWGMRAEYRVEGFIPDPDNFDYGTSHALQFVLADQVRFYDESVPLSYAHVMGGGYNARRRPDERTDPLRLEDIPPRVFSEVMRDIDMYVGVTSVGNDPDWTNTGLHPQLRNYAMSYAMAPLEISAESRREILKVVIPRLSIAKQCSFDDRNLIVQGKVNKYAIHIGSSSVMKLPEKRFVCIVPARRNEKNVPFLPYEGDARLSVIISKAFMLANDHKITDSLILDQIAGVKPMF